MSQWSKYFVVINEKKSVLAAVPGEKISVRGSVHEHEIIPLPPFNFGGKMITRGDAHGAGAPVTSSPEMFCDIHDNSMQFCETVKFVPDANGIYLFEVDVAAYTPGIYSLLTFYAVGENPADLRKHSKQFYVFSQQEVDEVKNLLKNSPFLQP